MREARAAAAVSHPNICQLFEIGEHEGDPFLAMELLDGRSLADRLEEGALRPSEAIPIAIGILSALDALHRRSIVHRDLKPSNVFLSAHGVKLLDFGLARPFAAPPDDTALTMPGVLLGTPRYMAPEQARGEELDARTDLFAVGSILFEMLSGRPAFGGASAVDALHAVLHEQPPALVGSLAIVDADRIIQRAMMKAPKDRYTSADEMAQDLRACLSRGDLTGGVVARATTRLMVLPFRILRQDPATDFLAFSLPDAITVSLAGLESLVVRSSLASARYSADQPDLRELASDAGVDAVVTGSLLQAGGLIRVSVQLIEVPPGTVLWSHAFQVPLDEMFQIQDAVCSAIVEVLALPLSSREQRLLRRDVPSSSEAYAHYLRANRFNAASQWQLARDAYERALEADPSYAPAWARYGRCLRILGKYGIGVESAALIAQAEEAFQRAFKINPELSLAHNLYTNVEVDVGRALDAVIRLLGQVRGRSSDPELFAGLVHACRYVGLLDASIAAYHRATRLDPGIRTSVAHSFMMAGEFERAIEADVDDAQYISASALLVPRPPGGGARHGAERTRPDVTQLPSAAARRRAHRIRGPGSRHDTREHPPPGGAAGVLRPGGLLLLVAGLRRHRRARACPGTSGADGRERVPRRSSAGGEPVPAVARLGPAIHRASRARAGEAGTVRTGLRGGRRSAPAWTAAPSALHGIALARRFPPPNKTARGLTKLPGGVGSPGCARIELLPSTQRVTLLRRCGAVPARRPSAPTLRSSPP